MTELTLTDNIVLLALSIFLFVCRLPVNFSDKLCLFITVFFPTSFTLLLLNYFLGIDFKIYSAGRY